MSDEERAQLRLEECRLLVRRHLYDVGSKVARSVTTIRWAINRLGYDCSDEEIDRACLFWWGADQFEEVRAEAGATRHYRITTAGIRAHEASLV